MTQRRKDAKAQREEEGWGVATPAGSRRGGRPTIALCLALASASACASGDPPMSTPPPPSPSATDSASLPPAVSASASASITPIVVGVVDYEARARAFVEALAAHRFEEAFGRFDKDMANAVPVVKLTEHWRSLEDAAGSFQRIDGAETTNDGEVNVVRVTTRFSSLRKVLRVVYGASGSIVGFFIGPEPKDMEARARALTDKIVKGDYGGATDAFDAIMKSALTADKLRTVWAQQIKKYGAFSEVSSVSVTPGTGGLWVALVSCKHHDGGTSKVPPNPPGAQEMKIQLNQGNRGIPPTQHPSPKVLVVKVVYDLREQVAGLFFLPGDVLAPYKPPSYAALDKITERDITVGANPALPGTLTLPKAQGPFPVVILLHGSGPADADETLGPNKVFKDLAVGLATKGIAVIRYVKRTRHAPAGVVTVKEEVIDGARAAVDLAKSDKDLDPKRVVIAGHSQGGYLAPKVAIEVPGVAALALLAAPTRPLQDSMLDQLEHLSKLDPQNADKKALITAAKRFKAKVEDPALKPDDAIDVPAGGVEKGAYFLALRGYQPEAEAKKLALPMLILQGDRDYQVTKIDLDGWRKALAGKANVTIKQYPALNHLFMAGTGTPRPAEYEVPSHVDEAVVNDLAAFVKGL